MTERRMATIRRIDKIEPIEGADKIVKATVGGWQLVTAIDNGFKEGDLVVYCEIDSWIPTEVAPFLSKGKEPREYNGVKGEKLRTIKLRGQVSQGLLLPMHVLTNYGADLEEGDDVSETLKIQKYEPPIPAQLAGQVKGNFPSQISKTDQERIQNLSKQLESIKKFQYEVTEKIEGSSMTAYIINGEFGVCSRNLDLKRDENNAFWKIAIAEKLEEKLRTFGKNIAIQGELHGEGIQGNIYNLKGLHFRVFDVFDVVNHKYYSPEQRWEFCHTHALSHVPILEKKYTFGDKTMQEIIALADGDSVLGTNPAREGIVFKAHGDVTLTFKVISNKYLTNQKD